MTSEDVRENGPFDIDEVDLDADDVERLDLGTLVLTVPDGAEVELQADSDVGQASAVVVRRGDSDLVLTLISIPKSGVDIAAEQDEVVASHKSQGADSTVVAGPLGPEVRSTLTHKNEQGQRARMGFRVWQVAGPRWMLRGMVRGRAAMQANYTGDLLTWYDCFCNVVVRRGDTAFPPDSIIPLNPRE